MLKFVAIVGALVAVPVLAYAGATLMSDTPAAPGSTAKSGPLACQIKVGKSTDGMMTLEGVVSADSPVKGTYRMRVTQKNANGSSDIDQGGAFDVKPGAVSSLNQMALSNDGAEYDAELTVTWPGGSMTCTEASAKSL